MTEEVVTRYYTQLRTDKRGEHDGQWEEFCSGHDTHYEAMRCHDGGIAVMLGVPLPGATHPLVRAIDSQIHAGFLAFKRDGYSIQLRVIKVVQTTEIVDEAQYIELTKITPKREAP